MAAARGIVAEILHCRIALEFFRQQSQQRNDIGLFHDLRVLRTLSPEHHVHGHGPACVILQIDVFQVEITAELLKHPGFKIEPGFYGFRDVPP